jgi:hypothetical protein
MAKKTTSNAKKAAPNAKQAGVYTRKKAEISQISADNAVHEQDIPLFPAALMDDIIESIKNCTEDFKDISDNALTPDQRKRKVGAGNKNYGFIDKASDLAEANEEYVQFFKINDLKNCIRNVEICRNIAEAFKGFWHAVTNTMLVYSDDAYSMALLFYNNVKAMAKRGDPMAKALAETLKTYFKKSKPAGAKPTKKEVIRDVKALERGTKDGKIEIENYSPKVTGGSHRVKDETFKDKAAFKDTDEGEIKE